MPNSFTTREILSRLARQGSFSEIVREIEYECDEGSDLDAFKRMTAALRRRAVKNVVTSEVSVQAQKITTKKGTRTVMIGDWIGDTVFPAIVMISAQSS